MAALKEDTRKQIDELIQKNRVMLFMKGNKSFPQCGFSATVVGILKELGTPFETANVLADAELREGIKIYSEWPTIPQLYVDGEFLGGCDIVREMHANGELAQKLGVKVEPAKAPSVTITEGAAKAIKAAEEGDPNEKLRLEINAEFQVDLYFSPKKQGDFEIASSGITLLVDPSSARRADGVRIDYVEGPGGAGFKIDNPNQPARVKQLSATELKAMLDAAEAAKEPVHLFDVRTDKERERAKIDAAIFFDAEGRTKLEKLDKNAKIVFHCHHGGRSQVAAEQALKQGFRDVYNLQGGIDAWSAQVDPKVARY